MHPMLKNWRIRVLIAAVVLAAGVILVKGIQLGVDFSGGTVLVFMLDRPLSQEEMQQVVQIISKRVDGTGLSSVVVRGWGDQYIVVELSTTDPEEIEYIKETVLRQGIFEVVVDGNVVLTGDEIIGVKPAKYSPLTEGVRWELPFTLSPEGVKNFYTGIKGKCTPEGKCKYSFMYIDRPVGSTILIPKKVAEEENYLPSVPVLSDDRLIPLEEFIKNAGVRAYIVDDNFNPEVLLGSSGEVILHPELNYLVPFLKENNIPYRIVYPEKGYSWIWRATNLRSVVRLTPGITQEDPARAPSTVLIEGWAKNREEAEKRVKELAIILRSGALPAKIQQLVSEQRIPPTYGKYAFYTFLAAILASMVTVSIYIAWRYRVWKIAGPIIATIFSETVLIFGFAALMNWKIDIPSMVGMIAATGTGVDDQIVITDEAIRGSGKNSGKKERGIVKRIKKAFFIVFATAGASLAVMLPVLGSDIPALKGFALTTTVGILVGILITRPAFAEMIRYVIDRDKK